MSDVLYAKRRISEGSLRTGWPAALLLPFWDLVGVLVFDRVTLDDLSL